MKKRAKKLSLKKETIRTLTSKELTKVAGGGTTRSAVTCTIQTTAY